MESPIPTKTIDLINSSNESHWELAEQLESMTEGDTVTVSYGGLSVTATAVWDVSEQSVMLRLAMPSGAVGYGPKTSRDMWAADSIMRELNVPRPSIGRSGAKA